MYEPVDCSRTGKKIQELRKERGLSAEELSKVLGTSASAINMYECGKRMPRDEIKIKIAEFFGLTVECIFYPSK